MTNADARPPDGAAPAYEQVFVVTLWPSGIDKWLCILTWEPDEIARRTGLRFQDGDDDLGEYREAALRLASGRQVVLCRHLKSPGAGTNVSVDDADDSPDALTELAAAFGLRDADFIWIDPEALGIEQPASE